MLPKPLQITLIDSLPLLSQSQDMILSSTLKLIAATLLALLIQESSFLQTPNILLCVQVALQD